MDLAITITIKPKYHKETIENQLDLLAVDAMQILNSLSCPYSLIMELTKACNAHLHGVLRYVGHRRKIYDAFRNAKICGFIYVREIDDPVKWIDYITKDITRTRQCLYCREPILRDDLKIIPIDLYYKEGVYIFSETDNLDYVPHEA